MWPPDDLSTINELTPNARLPTVRLILLWLLIQLHPEIQPCPGDMETNGVLR
jgi:hypothetical protein